MSGSDGIERRPAQAGPPRMEALARLPVFLALEGKRAVIAGNGPAAAWKAELLSAAGAEVEVFADDPSARNLAQWPRWRAKRAASAGNSSGVRAHSASEDIRAETPVFAGWCCERADDTRPEPGSSARAAQPPRGAVTLHQRAWQPEDLAGAAVAVGGIRQG